MTVPTAQTTTGTRMTTRRQVEYAADLLAQVTNWQQRLTGRALSMALNVATNDVDTCVIFMTATDVSNLLDTLIPLRSTKLTTRRPTQSPDMPVDNFAQLQSALKKINLGRYALPRKADGTIDFFEVVERGNGTRFVNQLLGGNVSGTKFHRHHLSMAFQAAATRAISADQRAAATLYADTYHECPRCGVALTHPRSITARIGKVCAGEWGWAW